MKTEYRIFVLLTGLMLFFAALYGWWTWVESGQIEFVGTVALILSGLLCLMCGGYFWFVSRRIEPRPEDRPDAEIAEGAGDIGFFSPGSYWPFGLALSALVIAVGTAYWKPWIIILGAVAVIGSVGGLLFEYYTGTRRSAYH